MQVSQEDDTGYRRWYKFVREALSCLDMNNYTWLHLPNKGGYYDQDDMIMCVWNYIRDCFVKMIHDEKVTKALALRNKHGKSKS